MKVAILQVKPSRKENIDKFIKQAAKKNAKLIILPEACNIGYDLDIIRKQKTINAQDFINKLYEFCKKYKLMIAAGVIEQKLGNYYNNLVLIDEHGVIARYTKTHLIQSEPFFEHKYLTAGTKNKIITTKLAKFGLILCYDLRFPELTRQLALQGAEIIIVASAWPKSRAHVLDTLCKARAIENQCFLISANYATGKYAGLSQAITPTGEVLGRAKQNETIIYIEIDLKEINKARTFMNCFAQRRTDLYS